MGTDAILIGSLQRKLLRQINLLSEMRVDCKLLIIKTKYQKSQMGPQIIEIASYLYNPVVSRDS